MSKEKATEIQPYKPQLKPKHEEIVNYWLNNKSTKIEAYQNTYKTASYKTASKQFDEMAKRPEVKEYIEQRRKDIEQNSKIESYEIAKELKSYIYQDRTQLLGLNEDEIKQLPIELKRSIEGIKTKKRRFKEGSKWIEETTTEIKLTSKMESVKELNKMLGNYEKNNEQKRNVNIMVDKFLNIADADTLNSMLKLMKQANNGHE